MPALCSLPSYRSSAMRALLSPLVALLPLVFAACASIDEAAVPTRQENVFALTSNHELIRFQSGAPQRILDRTPLRGLAAGDRVIGIDYRVSRDVMFALAASGQLYTVNTANGQLIAVGTAPLAIALVGKRFGFDFNPAADRIRVVSDAGLNLRLHPDTGAAADADPVREGLQADGNLAYVAGDINAGRIPQLIAAGYTYNNNDDKITTNYALDIATGSLVIQGSKEGVTPVVSPNTGRLITVGALGVPTIEDAALDITDVSNVALAALRINNRTRLYQIDLQSGRASTIGTIDEGGAVLGMAIAP